MHYRAGRYSAGQEGRQIQADTVQGRHAGKQIHYRAGRYIYTLQSRQAGRYTTGQADIVQGRKAGR